MKIGPLGRLKRGLFRAVAKQKKSKSKDSKGHTITKNPDELGVPPEKTKEMLENSLGKEPVPLKEHLKKHLSEKVGKITQNAPEVQERADKVGGLAVVGNIFPVEEEKTAESSTSPVETKKDQKERIEEWFKDFKPGMNQQFIRRPKPRKARVLSFDTGDTMKVEVISEESVDGSQVGRARTPTVDDQAREIISLRVIRKPFEWNMMKVEELDLTEKQEPVTRSISYKESQSFWKQKANTPSPKSDS